MSNQQPFTFVECMTSAFGLTNLGNTCYMNATLQMLLTVDEFRQYILDIDKYLGNLNDVYGVGRIPYYNYYVFVFRELLMSRNNRRSTKNLHNAILYNFQNDGINYTNYNIGIQNDAFEFLTHLINSISKEINSIEEKKIKNNYVDNDRSNFFNELFYFELENIRSPVDIHREPIHPGKKEMLSTLILYLDNIKSGEIVNIQDLINQRFIKTFSGDSKQIDLECTKFNQPSEYIVVSLARYRYIGLDGRVEKNDYPVKILKNINIGKYFYNIISITEHIGNSRNSGHYVNYSQRVYSWYSFNDGNVQKVDFPKILFDISERGNSYLLLYRRAPEFQQLENRDGIKIT